MLKTYILTLLRNKIIFHRALRNEKANVAVPVLEQLQQKKRSKKHK